MLCNGGNWVGLVKISRLRTEDIYEGYGRCLVGVKMVKVGLIWWLCEIELICSRSGQAF